ncbi:MAG: VWA domain-containing protein [Bacteroidia bacterium]|jgi:hypothetical protein|nr:VWA domain-containing protein [Bacteroidia bacterium]
MRKLSVLIALVLVSAGIPAQNLIPNPSLESDTTYPVRNWPTQNMAGTPLTDGWIIPTRATPDYFNSDYSFIDYSPLMLARSGKGRVALICGLGQQLPESRNYKEYIQASLLRPMEAGKTYEVSFYMALDRAASYSTAGMGAYFSSEALRSDNKERFRVKPQVRYNKIITVADGWVRVSGTIKASGGERFITIGSFSDTAVVPVSMLGQGYWTGPASMHVRRGAYIYLDDVCVAEQKPEGCECSVPKDQEEPAETIVPGNPRLADHYLFVIDASESMGDDGKLKEMRKQITNFSKKLNAADRIAVISFSEKPIIHFGFSAMHSPEAIERTLKKIKPRGATNGDLALLTAARFIDSVRVNAPLHLIVATDGMFTISRRTEVEIDSALLRRNCALRIMHIGTVENLDLKRIAERQQNGSYTETSLDGLDEVFTQLEPPPAPEPLPSPTTKLKPRKYAAYTDMEKAADYFGPGKRED